MSFAFLRRNNQMKSDLIAIEYIDFTINRLIVDKDILSEYKTKFLEDFEKAGTPYVNVRTEYHVGGLIRMKIDSHYDNGKEESHEYDNYVVYRNGNAYRNSIFYQHEVGRIGIETGYLVVRRDFGSLCVSLGFYLDNSHWITEKDVFKLDLSRENMEKYYKPKSKVDIESGYQPEARNYSCGESMENPWTNSVDCLNWRITTVDYNKTTFARGL